MDKLIHKLNEEFECWVKDLIVNTDLCNDKLLSLYAYKYCIKKEIVDYLEWNTISDEFHDFLMSKSDALEFLYQEYMSSDIANIQNEIDHLISNVNYKFKTIEK